MVKVDFNELSLSAWPQGFGATSWLTAGSGAGGAAVGPGAASRA